MCTSVRITGYPRKECVQGLETSKFRQISNNISKTVQDRDVVTVEAIVCGISNDIITIPVTLKVISAVWNLSKHYTSEHIASVHTVCLPANWKAYVTCNFSSLTIYQHEEFARLQAVVYTVHVVMFRIRCTIVTLYYRPLIGSDTDDLSNCATSNDLQWRSRSCICWKPFEMQQLTVLQMIWCVVPLR